MLAKFFKSIESGDIYLANGKDILDGKRYIYSTLHKYRHSISRSELEDLQQDIIVIILEADKTYIKEKSSFLTYLSWQLKKVNNDFFNKYFGIVHSSRQRAMNNKNGIFDLIRFEGLDEQKQ